MYYYQFANINVDGMLHALHNPSPSQTVSLNDAPVCRLLQQHYLRTDFKDIIYRSGKQSRASRCT